MELFFPYQKRCPHRLMTASLAVSRQMLHSNVLSWLPPSPPAVELLDPELAFSAAAAVAVAPGEPLAGEGEEGAALAISTTASVG